MKIRQGEKGFTLVEMLIVTVLVVIIVGAAAAAIISIERFSPVTNDMAVAFRQVQNAGYWISQDVTMATHAGVQINGQLPTIIRSDWDNAQQQFVTHNIQYIFNQQAQTLIRSDNGVSMQVSESINTNDTKFEDITPNPQGSNKKEYRFTVRATVNNADITRIYYVSPRLP
jgi:prepilin-type N-terminal cleavage/methylation domain-containing protein